MKNYLPDFVKKRFNVSLEDLPEVEHRIVQHLGERRHISRDTNLEFEKKLTLANDSPIGLLLLEARGPS